MTPNNASYIFITSSPFSGSTLLSFLLGVHPEIAVVSAVAGSKRERMMNTYRCSCQKLMCECEFWLDVQSKMHTKGFTDFDLANFKLNFTLDGPLIGRRQIGAGSSKLMEAFWDGLLNVWPGYSDHLHAIADRTRAFAISVLEITGKNVFLDATKQPTRTKYLIDYLDMDVKIIHLVRDVRGNVNSTLRHKQNDNITVCQAAKKWTRENTVILHCLERLPIHKQILVHYEDICLDTQNVTKQLYEFCGVDPTVSLNDFRAQTEHQHILGNQMRLRVSSDITLDERWRQSLTKESLQQINQVAGHLMKRFYQNDVD